MYDFHPIRLNDYITIHFLNIDEIEHDFEELIIASIRQICGGRYSEYSLDFFKGRLTDFFREKLSDRRTAMGAIAEFIIHVHLNNLSFSQECMFFNLEELSIKKGFDGYYSFGGEQWIMESKSSEDIEKKHDGKIREAYSDLKNKIETRVSNNPWYNAYNHMRTVNVNTDVSIVSRVRQFSEEFQRGTYQQIANFNIMPCSTLYLGDSWTPINNDELETKLTELCQRIDYQKIHIICINNRDFERIINMITA